MLLEPVGKSCSVEALDGAVAQLGEHLLCKQGVSGSIPLSSTIFLSSCSVLTLSRSSIASLRTARRTIGDGLSSCMGDLIRA